jgi:hypothetical protein
MAKKARQRISYGNNLLPHPLRMTIQEEIAYYLREYQSFPSQIRPAAID